MLAEWLVWISQSWYQSSNLRNHRWEPCRHCNNHNISQLVLLLRRKFSLWTEVQTLKARASNILLSQPHSLNLL